MTTLAFVSPRPWHIRVPWWFLRAGSYLLAFVRIIIRLGAIIIPKRSHNSQNVLEFLCRRATQHTYVLRTSIKFPIRCQIRACTLLSGNIKVDGTYRTYKREQSVLFIYNTFFHTFPTISPRFNISKPWPQFTSWLLRFLRGALSIITTCDALVLNFRNRYQYVGASLMSTIFVILGQYITVGQFRKRAGIEYPQSKFGIFKKFYHTNQFMSAS